MIIICAALIRTDVPEFGTWALLVALGLVAGGIVSMRGGSTKLRGGMRGRRQMRSGR